MRVSGQHHALLPGKRPGVHCTGGLLGPRRLYVYVWKISHTPEFDPLTVKLIAIS